MIGGVEFTLVTVGTVVGDSFCWSWANEALPASAKVNIERVRQFGVENGLTLLNTPCLPGGLPQGQECLAIAGRVLDADGAWVDRTNTGHILFVLYERDATRD